MKQDDVKIITIAGAAVRRIIDKTNNSLGEILQFKFLYSYVYPRLLVFTFFKLVYLCLPMPRVHN